MNSVLAYMCTMSMPTYYILIVNIIMMIFIWGDNANVINAINNMYIKHEVHIVKLPFLRHKIYYLIGLIDIMYIALHLLITSRSIDFEKMVQSKLYAIGIEYIHEIALDNMTLMTCAILISSSFLWTLLSYMDHIHSYNQILEERDW